MPRKSSNRDLPRISLAQHSLFPPRPTDPVACSDTFPINESPDHPLLAYSHPPRHSFTQRFAWCAQRYREGLSDAQIAVLEAVPEPVIRGWREAVGYPPLPDDPITAAVLLPYLDGLKTAAIAAAGGVPAEAVLAWYTAHDISGSRGRPRSEDPEPPHVLTQAEKDAAAQNFPVRQRGRGHRETQGDAQALAPGEAPVR